MVMPPLDHAVNLDALQRRFGRSKSLKPSTGVDDPLKRGVIRFNPIVLSLFVDVGDFIAREAELVHLRYDPWMGLLH